MKNVIKPLLATRSAFHRLIDQRYENVELGFEIAGKSYALKRSSVIEATLPLGLLSAATSIGLALNSDVSALLIGSTALLSLTSLASLAAMVRAQKPFAFFGANLAAWIACGGFMAAQSPILGLAALTLSVASFFAALASAKVRPIATRSVSNNKPKAVTVNSSDILLNKKGEVLANMMVQGAQLRTGDRFIERLHVHDRVAFMRAVSQILANESSQEKLHVMINVASEASAAQFKSVALNLIARSGQIAVCLSERQQAEAAVLPDEASSSTINANNFLAVVSHELRTPLNAIIGFSDILRHDNDRDLPEATRDEYAELIHGAGSHLLALVNTILDVSKMEAGSYSIHRENFDFHSTVHDCVALLGQTAAQKKVQINERFTPQLGTINADRRAVKQILFNLLSNAIKYTGEGGFITVDAAQNENEITIEVSDTGIGMSEDDLNEIGKPFAQVNNSLTRSNEGTGLGLTLVKGLTALHGGRCEIRSKLNVGTRVIITIPATQPSTDSIGHTGASVINLTALMTKTPAKSVDIENKEVTKNERKIG